MKVLPKYLCMDCENYRKCKVNEGIMCDFVKESEVIDLGFNKYHIHVIKCDGFIKRKSPLDIPDELMEVITEKKVRS